MEFESALQSWEGLLWSGTSEVSRGLKRCQDLSHSLGPLCPYRGEGLLGTSDLSLKCIQGTKQKTQKCWQHKTDHTLKHVATIRGRFSISAKLEPTLGTVHSSGAL